MHCNRISTEAALQDKEVAAYQDLEQNVVILDELLKDAILFCRHHLYYCQAFARIPGTLGSLYNSGKQQVFQAGSYTPRSLQQLLLLFS